MQVAELLTHPPAKALKRFPAKDYTFYRIDLDQDGQLDFIVEHRREWKTCFVKFDLSLAGCERLNFSLGEEGAYQYFIKPSKSGTLIHLDLSHTSDDDDYAISRIDPKTWRLGPKRVLYPLVRSTIAGKKGIYWGYPGDLRKLPLKKSAEPWRVLGIGGPDVRKILGEEDDPSKSTAGRPYMGHQKKGGVALLFDGAPSQGESAGDFTQIEDKLRWITFSELLGWTEK